MCSSARLAAVLAQLGEVFRLERVVRCEHGSRLRRGDNSERRRAAAGVSEIRLLACVTIAAASRMLFLMRALTFTVVAMRPFLKRARG